ncbi:ferritin-like domain-containing protein [Marinomonas transparens]|uniref:DUF2202 domain-containing protein n=1 Tax=Marinomonas transparens TaxID=2795388 RepID=A0A934JV65_9GAMM|nr:DUF2202 domain-containing protein [Marinomonas transparens]MBJ7537905.1 DUF2202 domain-containing protein [Marinomonas transparens]
MKNNLRLWLKGGLITCLMICLPALASGDNYGAVGAENLSDKELTLEVMLNFALEDEYLARGEYQKIIETFGGKKPFTNIIKAEEKHITWLVPLFEKYGIALPVDRGMESAVIPANYEETFSIGVAAEIANIDMYSRFLKLDLPSEVEDVFMRLRKASENHLAAFQRWEAKY